jgi:hypothetical protein
MMRSYLELEIAPVLHKHKITSASVLNKRLEEAAKTKEERVDVYDLGNSDRLLGSVPKPDWRGGRSLRVAAMGRLSVTSWPTDPCEESVSVTTVDFEASIKRGPNPLDVRGVLTTTAPLKHLLMLRDFRLPGETEEQAHVRSMYC